MKELLHPYPKQCRTCRKLCWLDSEYGYCSLACYELGRAPTMSMADCLSDIPCVDYLPRLTKVQIEIRGRFRDDLIAAGFDSRIYL